MRRAACLAGRSFGARPSALAAPRGGRRALSNADSGQTTQITEARLQQFLRAEVSFFAERRANSISLRQILDAEDPLIAARLSHAELPIRFAQRIQQIEDLPHWGNCEDLRHVHDLYSESFRSLRLIEFNRDNLHPFTGVVKALKLRMRGVIPRLSTAMNRIQREEDVDEAVINDWLDTFLLSRIGTEMLTSQYMACVAPDKALGARPGIVDDACDPANICMQAVKHSRRLCKQHFKSKHDLKIIVESKDDGTGDGKIRFPYVPQYLFYIMVELLKNSARATMESCGDNPKLLEQRPIVVTVGADSSQVGIRVDDLAGGIPFNVADRVWSYMYTTASQSGEARALSQEGTPLAGYGVGLPLSRLYARYLGGSLQLMSLPGIGTSAYLYLKRLETEAREELPPSLHTSLGSSSLKEVL